MQRIRKCNGRQGAHLQRPRGGSGLFPVRLLARLLFRRRIRSCQQQRPRGERLNVFHDFVIPSLDPELLMRVKKTHTPRKPHSFASLLLLSRACPSASSFSADFMHSMRKFAHPQRKLYRKFNFHPGSEQSDDYGHGGGGGRGMEVEVGVGWEFQVETVSLPFVCAFVRSGK